MPITPDIHHELLYYLNTIEIVYLYEANYLAYSNFEINPTYKTLKESGCTNGVKNIFQFFNKKRKSTKS